jgi:steroid delta-isomerase-like uncharacterized protein
MTADELIAGWERAWSGHDPDAFGPLCAPDVHYEDPLTAFPLRGAAEIGAHARRLWAGLPDARVAASGAALHDERHAALPWRLTGTHTERLGSLPPSGRSLTVHGVFYCRLALGRLVRVRAFFDAYDAAVQLAVLPARDSLGERALLLLRGFGFAGRPTS